MPKILENIVGPWENVLLLLTAVALVWMLLRELGIGVTVTKSGFTAFATWADDNLKDPRAWRSM